MAFPFMCGRCDGCGWYEGGAALRTGCEECGGLGYVMVPDDAPASPDVADDDDFNPCEVWV